MTIKQITGATISRYRDNGQVQARIQWVDGRGKTGSTEGSATRIGDKHYQFGQHMAALLNRAEREGVVIYREDR